MLFCVHIHFPINSPNKKLTNKSGVIKRRISLIDMTVMIINTRGLRKYLLKLKTIYNCMFHPSLFKSKENRLTLTLNSKCGYQTSDLFFTLVCYLKNQEALKPRYQWYLWRKIYLGNTAKCRAIHPSEKGSHTNRL